MDSLKSIVVSEMRQTYFEDEDTDNSREEISEGKYSFHKSYKILRKYDLEEPQSQTAEKSVALQGRATQQS